jgi:hypothetical protein
MDAPRGGIRVRRNSIAPVYAKSTRNLPVQPIELRFNSLISLIF